MSLTGCTTSSPDAWAFASTGTMVDETVLFSNDIEPRSACLLFQPLAVLSVKAADDSVSYVAGKDYVVDLDAGILRLTEDSAITSYTLYGDVIKHGQFKNRKGEPILWAEADFMHSIQCKVTYTHSGTEWKDKPFVPRAQVEALPGISARLRDKEACRVVLVGDSISEGYNASGFVGVPPHLPAYGEQVVAKLRERTGAEVAFLNCSRAGAASGWGVGQVDKLTAHNPDLAIIAFGMNDAGRGGHSDRYKKNVAQIIAGLRAHDPATEIILVANMLPNEEFKPQSAHFENRERLLELAAEGDGVVVADVMSVTAEMLKRKKFADISGNNLNHPNDFIHRLYASVILRVMGW